jgi:hypothetical protein
MIIPTTVVRQTVAFVMNLFSFLVPLPHPTRDAHEYTCPLNGSHERSNSQDLDSQISVDLYTDVSGAHGPTLAAKPQTHPAALHALGLGIHPCAVTSPPWVDCQRRFAPLFFTFFEFFFK